MVKADSRNTRFTRRRGKQVLPVLTNEEALPPELIDFY